MNKNTTTRLTDAEIHQLKYPKAQIVDVDIFEDETLSEQDIMAMVDQQHLTPPPNGTAYAARLFGTTTT